MGWELTEPSRLSGATQVTFWAQVIAPSRMAQGVRARVRPGHTGGRGFHCPKDCGRRGSDSDSTPGVRSKCHNGGARGASPPACQVGGTQLLAAPPGTVCLQLVLTAGHLSTATVSIPHPPSKGYEHSGTWPRTPILQPPAKGAGQRGRLGCAGRHCARAEPCQGGACKHDAEPEDES